MRSLRRCFYAFYANYANSSWQSSWRLQ